MCAIASLIFARLTSQVIVLTAGPGCLQEYQGIIQKGQGIPVIQKGQGIPVIQKGQGIPVIQKGQGIPVIQKGQGIIQKGQVVYRRARVYTEGPGYTGNTEGPGYTVKSRIKAGFAYKHIASLTFQFPFHSFSFSLLALLPPWLAIAHITISLASAM